MPGPLVVMSQCVVERLVAKRGGCSRTVGSPSEARLPAGQLGFGPGFRPPPAGDGQDDGQPRQWSATRQTPKRQGTYVERSVFVAPGPRLQVTARVRDERASVPTLSSRRLGRVARVSRSAIGAGVAPASAARQQCPRRHRVPCEAQLRPLSWPTSAPRENSSGGHALFAAAARCSARMSE
jgi:hypothetical protein